ncbi:MAG: hypothetical protein WCK78_04115 [Paludibacter sp.]
MKVFGTIEAYKEEAKKGDRFVLGGVGIMDGLKNFDHKEEVFTLVHFDGEYPVFRRFQGRTNLTTRTNQKVGLLTESEYKNLKTFRK